MAKIIDFKTRKVLAELPTDMKSPRFVQGFRVDNDMKFLGIIAYSQSQAECILFTARVGLQVAKHFNPLTMKGA
jgi:hypothetical protein